MTPTHKPEDGDRAPISNGGMERIRQALVASELSQGPWQVIVTEHPHMYGGTHTERRIFTTWDHPQLKGPLGVVNSSVGAPAEEGGAAIHLFSIHPPDAEYIAACNPVAIRTLLAAHDDATALLAEKAQRIERLEAALRECLDDLEYLAKAPDSAYARPDDSTLELARAALSQPHPHGG